MKRVFTVKHRSVNTSVKHPASTMAFIHNAPHITVKRGASSLHQNKSPFVSVHIFGWFAHGTLDRF
jgi:hypothetical protein